MDQKLQEFVTLLHRPGPGAPQRRGRRLRARGLDRRTLVIAVAAAIVLCSLAVALWFVWPSLAAWPQHSSQQKPTAHATSTFAATLPRAETPTPGTAAPQASTTPPLVATPPAMPPAPAAEQQLQDLERIARRNGSAIAIGHPHDQTLEMPQRRLRELPQKGLALVPVSAIVRERGTPEVANDTTGVMR